MKQGRVVHSGRSPIHLVLTPYEASVNMRHFTNRLNKAVYGNAASRHGMRVPIIAVQEGGSGIRLHYHAIIDCPHVDLVPGFPSLINELWGKTPWGHREIQVRSNPDEGWIDYISKACTKSDYADAFDWTNCHNPRPLS
ncbi:rolling circle replication-associated protein [Sphingomonas sp. PWP1-2]|uniref:rolling circle replication-associated protein n=1 Tax=Sphingomonas sp. PWP1-2 TaxID=2804558 RepID=UPI003CE6EF0F